MTRGNKVPVTMLLSGLQTSAIVVTLPESYPMVFSNKILNTNGIGDVGDYDDDAHNNEQEA